MRKISFTLITLISLQCFAQGPCVWDDGFYRYYTKLSIDNIPAPDFDKTSFINHLITNSNPSSADLDFLNNSITEVSLSFPTSQTEFLRKIVTVETNYDSMIAFLSSFPESIEFSEFYCEDLLGTESFDLENRIKIYPNPVSENSFIQIDQKAGFKILEIYDLTGKLLFSLTIENLSLMKFSQLKFENGVYFLKFISDNLVISKKIIYK